MAYRITRFFRDDRPSELVRVVDTLDEAQEWCRREDTQGDGWFDGYAEIDDDYQCECDDAHVDTCQGCAR